MLNSNYNRCTGVDRQLQLFFDEQLLVWRDVRQRFCELESVKTKTLKIGALTMKVQYNPARMVSTGAKIDVKTLTKRPCFLCEENRPPIQIKQKINHDFELLVNPYPILPQHFTIPLRRHQQQQIALYYYQIHELLTLFPQLMVFYNGPKCGASAPDHLHFQAGNNYVLPLQSHWQALVKSLKPIVTMSNNDSLSVIEAYPCAAFAIKSSTAQTDKQLFDMLYRALPLQQGDTEPMMNIVAWREKEEYISVVFPRRKHRPTCYFAKDEEQMLISPGALDMAGLMITPRERDFERLSATQLEQILEEMAITKQEMQAVVDNLSTTATNNQPKMYNSKQCKEPQVSVGIVSAKEISFTLNHTYLAKGESVKGKQNIAFDEGGILWKGQVYRELTFIPQDSNATFTLNDVTIGINFHWERKEKQTFFGALRLVVEGDKIYAINDIEVEKYLESVISSEMKASSSLQLLKAHAVISRSWLLAQIEKRHHLEKNKNVFFSFIKKESELIKWYDREDHTLFDVCADDHCQRYQGITKETNQYVSTAIQQTRGQILMYGNQICDARFSKCCGGMSENYEYCWENEHKPYLTAVRDIAPNEQQQVLTNNDLTVEKNAEAWIRTTPKAFCYTKEKKILSQVLNNYDQETIDFYRWKVVYSQKELSTLIEEKTKMKFGNILDLIPIERGRSGRISKLKIVGSKLTFIIGKELEIRRTLSQSHLYSSAFVVDKENICNGIPQQFVLIGAGWGHGVGLCQIGAAMMGEKGYQYQEILAHYYRGATIQKLYE